MKIALLLCALFAACYAVSVNEQALQLEFTSWMAEHGKSYGTDEFQYRWQTWKSNHKFVNEHNAKNLTYSVALNKFADLSSKEFGKVYNGFLGAKMNTRIHPSEVVIAPNPAAPASIDWRSKGYVTGIKNQGQCGSCWSFSTTGSTEGQHFKETGSLVGLSEQNLMDCSQSYGNQGCNGGLMDDAFQYIIANGGIDTEASYPYTAQDGTCNFQPSDVGATIKSWSYVTQNDDENAMQQSLYSTGPASICVDASSWQNYQGGVLSDCGDQVDHCVQLTGFSTQDGTPAWNVRNSWNTDWGVSGYIYLARGGNTCDIGSDVIILHE